ncbi:helix-turn-helix domain-containing protein [Krasilnikovia sp. M28-CT-15]|uniref:helix-turn-helix domain-containing protein n=1 Tax=Krasilnikovia sp. M28-CT-15 TaxID=3373540 RepID=UPI0038772C12
MPARRHGLAHRRKTIGLSQERLAEAVGVDRSTVVRWERAETEPQPWHRPKLATALRISVEELAELLAPPPPRPISSLASFGSRTAEDVATPAAGSDDLDVVRSFRAADRQVGGAGLYSAVTSYLQRVVAPRVFGQTPDRDGERVFAAAANLTEMAGWMAHDCGHDEIAWQHFTRASSMAVASRDHQLAAHIFGSLSHLAIHLRQPRAAISHALRGQEQIALADRHPGLEARLLALRARGHAATGDADACLDDLRRAEAALERPLPQSTSLWANNYDAASLAVDTARCLHQIGHLGSAWTQVEQVSLLRPPDRVRSRALAQLILVSILIAQHRPEEACAVARRVLDATTALGSVQVSRQLEALGGGLQAYRNVRCVDEFRQRLRDELTARRWMTQFSGGVDPIGTGPL